VIEKADATSNHNRCFLLNFSEADQKYFVDYRSHTNALESFNCRILEDCAICEPSQTPSVDPIFRPKSLTSTDPSYHPRVHPRNPKWVHQHPSYSLAHLEENGHRKGHQGAANWVIDVIEFEDLSCNIIVAGDEGDDYTPTLLEQTVRTDIGDSEKMQTCSYPIHHANHPEAKSHSELSRSWWTCRGREEAQGP
jgi:hypothetical protein